MGLELVVVVATGREMVVMIVVGRKLVLVVVMVTVWRRCWLGPMKGEERESGRTITSVII